MEPASREKLFCAQIAAKNAKIKYLREVCDWNVIW